MAVAPLTPNEQAELNRLLEENVEIKERIRILNEKIALATGSERDDLEAMAQTEKIRLRLQTDSAKELKKRQKFLEDEESSMESLASMSHGALKVLQKQASGANTLASLTNKILERKEAELQLEGDALKASQKETAVLESMNASIMLKAEELAAIKHETSDAEKEIEKLERSIAHLSGDAKDEAEAHLKTLKNLNKQLERTEAIHEANHELLHHMPGFIGDALGMAKKMVAQLAVMGAPLVIMYALIGAALHSFIALDAAAQDFRKETGLLNSQTKDLVNNAHHIEMNFRDAGVELKTVFDTAKALKEEFSDTVNVSEEVLASLSVMGTNFGISAGNAAKVQSVLESVGGLSSETAANVGNQVANMAKLAGVAPDKVFKDIAENAEAASTFFKGDINALTKNAIQAQRMGTSLKQQVSLAEKLLDFENGIEQELVAATFVGGEFNLSRARALAMEGKLQEANEETLKQIQRSGDFRQKDYFTQQQLAKAAGMSVEEINKQLMMQEKLNGLTEEEKKLASDAIDKGLDITNMTKEQLAEETKKIAAQNEQQGQLARMQNAFMGIVATVGGVLSPLLEGVASVLNLILMPINAIVEGMAHFIDYVKQSTPLLLTLLGITTAIAVQKGLAYLNTKNELGVTIAKAAYDKASLAIQALIANIKNRSLLKSVYNYALDAAGSIARIPYVGWALAAGVAASAIGYGMSLYSKAGDVMSPADGKTRVSTKEGGLFELSKNDDLMAGPGLAGAAAGGGGGGGLSALAAPLAAVVNEIKALRADMASGKIAVYMDSAKVTSGVNTQVEKTTRNNYNIGQA
jgi:DNA repair exonuclease SbcCD ATPase subunit